ncbi:uncharacterized protein V1516DRAFT_682580 [Lipomyces oligophaga]|uniref:uncharacterized protein n=1 Tax=Lipomyces oligophaga TaxID=45792 RepID=UPI0034CD1260
MSAAEYHKGGNNYGPPSGPPPGMNSDRGYPSQPQQAYGGQGGYYPQQQQGGYYNGPPQGGYYNGPQQGYPQQGYQGQQQPNTVYVQQQPQRSDSDGCLMGCCAALCVCCTLDALC